MDRITYHEAILVLRGMGHGQRINDVSHHTEWSSAGGGRGIPQNDRSHSPHATRHFRCECIVSGECLGQSVQQGQVRIISSDGASKNVTVLPGPWMVLGEDAHQQVS